MKTFNESEWDEYRKAHPKLRFFQALRDYMKTGYILLAETDNEIPDRQFLQDTFYIKDDRKTP